MDIQCEEIPFKLTFFEGTEEKPNIHQVVNFCTEEEQLNLIEPNIILKENLSLKLLFTCDDLKAKLYMDGLDILEEKFLEEDDNGNSYLVPMERPISLLSYNQQEYPLVPGYYRIIVLVKSVYYFSQFKIIPTRLTEPQWELMRNELESDLRGLAQDFVRRNLGFNGVLMRKNSPLPTEILYRFLIIQSRFSSIMIALTDLVDKINFKVIKEYRIVEGQKCKSIDAETIKYRLNHPEKGNVLKIPANILHYNLPENRWIKKIIRYINKCIDEFMNALDHYLQVIYREIEELVKYDYKNNNERQIYQKKQMCEDLIEYKEQASKIKNAIKIIQNAPWYEFVQETAFDPINYTILGDSRYRSLYQLYRELKKDSFEVLLDTSYTYQWKRTDKLYEIWGFLQIYKAMTGEILNYEVKKGWLADEKIKSDQFIIPTLSPGTRIEMIKDDLSVNLIYDGKIPYRSQDSDHLLNPIYMQGSHNRPDARLDIFRSGTYAGSLLIDFKYRNPLDFWSTIQLLSHHRPRDMNQLISYGSQSSSIYLFGEIDNEYLRCDMRPVREVWAIYPKEYANKNDNFYSDHRLRMIKLCPGDYNRKLGEKLKSVIEDAISRLEHFEKKDKR